MAKAKTTTTSKSAIAASRKYPEKNVWYFRNGSNECFVIGGNNLEAFRQSGISSTLLGVEKRLYRNGKKIG